ncbi:hypothetical protein HDU96_000600 [Phlyctochytrium bullatum]|nr:hypothetical protein HDU96_000600 [Phlyctochytrium bullatum]
MSTLQEWELRFFKPILTSDSTHNLALLDIHISDNLATFADLLDRQTPHRSYPYGARDDPSRTEATLACWDCPRCRAVRNASGRFERKEWRERNHKEHISANRDKIAAMDPIYFNHPTIHKPTKQEKEALKNVMPAVKKGGMKRMKAAAEADMTRELTAATAGSTVLPATGFIAPAFAQKPNPPPTKPTNEAAELIGQVLSPNSDRQTQSNLIIEFVYRTEAFRRAVSARVGRTQWNVVAENLVNPYDDDDNEVEVDVDYLLDLVQDEEALEAALRSAVELGVKNDEIRLKN